jgi:hypothetical protein
MMPVSRASIHIAACVLSIPLAVALSVTAAQAQSLGDVARKTAPARAGSASKVYTNESLPASTSAAAGAPQAAGQQDAAGQSTSATSKTTADAAAGKTPTGAAAASDTKGATEEKDEKYWRQRIQAEREALARAESFAEALQSRINALSNDFVNRDDPAQRNVIAGDRQKALTELERVRKEIAQHTQAIADIQQEARRAGVPAGWVR